MDTTLGSQEPPSTIQNATKKQTSLVTFGDSNTDSGNTYRFTNNTWPADPGYHEGRFTNGPLWTEIVAKRNVMELDDYAIGGATTDNKYAQGYTGFKADVPVPSVVDQSESYLKRAISGEAPKADDSIFSLMLGGSDVFLDAHATVANSIEATVRVINNLKSHGAKHFILASTPDIALMPYRNYISQDELRRLSSFFLELRDELKKASAEIGPEVVFVDFYDLLCRVMKDPEQFGFDAEKSEISCLIGPYAANPNPQLAWMPPVRVLHPDPERFVFFDALHASSRMNEIMADFAIAEIKKIFDLGSNA